jgi:hypothetical protein
LNTINKILLAITATCFLALFCHAQMTGQGFSGQGFNSGNGLTDYFKTQGLVHETDSRYGASGIGTTNVQIWVDKTGNYSLRQSSSTNPPTFSQSVGSQAFQAVQFNGNQQFLINHSLGQIIGANSNNGVIIAQLTFDKTSSNSKYSLWAGYSGATSTIFSVFACLPTGSALTNNLWRASADNASTVLTAKDTVTNLNAWAWNALVYANGSAISFKNLLPATSASPGTARHIDTFSIGAAVHSNMDVIASSQKNCAVAHNLVFTNAASWATGTMWTNIYNLLISDRPL